MTVNKRISIRKISCIVFVYKKRAVCIFSFSKKLGQIFLIIMAMAAIGLNSNVIHLIKTGGKPLLVGASCWCGITIVTLLMQHVMGIW